MVTFKKFAVLSSVLCYTDKEDLTNFKSQKSLIIRKQILLNCLHSNIVVYLSINLLLLLMLIDSYTYLTLVLVDFDNKMK